MLSLLFYDRTKKVLYSLIISIGMAYFIRIFIQDKIFFNKVTVILKNSDKIYLEIKKYKRENENMTKPSIYHSQGYNCAEAIIKSYNEEFNTNIPVALGSGMGTGMTVGSLCGAVNAAVLVASFIKGRESSDSPNEARKYSKEIMNKVRKQYNTELCVNLKSNKVSCGEIIDFSYNALKEVLKNA